MVYRRFFLLLLRLVEKEDPPHLQHLASTQPYPFSTPRTPLRMIVPSESSKSRSPLLQFRIHAELKGHTRETWKRDTLNRSCKFAIALLLPKMKVRVILLVLMIYCCQFCRRTIVQVANVEGIGNGRSRPLEVVAQRKKT